MIIFLSTLNQMAILMLFIAIGYILARFNIVEPGVGVNVLSKLESYVLIPALLLSTFMKNFTFSRINTAWKYILCSFVVIGISIPIAYFTAKRCSKDPYTQNIYIYGLTFSNFGFMGIAIVAAVFPWLSVDYLIFILPLWISIYIWGAPYLLVPIKGNNTIKGKLMALVNPMFIAMFVGIIIGILNIPVPSFIGSTASELGGCMSSVAMLLTGMSIAQYSVKNIFKNISIYVVTFMRLLVMPIAAIIVLKFINLPYGLALCTVCSLAMPLGLNTIVIPSAYNKDTSAAVGMAIVSHMFSFLTIPFVFMLFNMLVK